MLILSRTTMWSSGLNLYLAVRPEGRKKISSPLWHFGLMAGSFRTDAVSRHHLQIPAGACLGVDPDQTKQEALLREGPLVKKIDAVQFNAKLSNPLNAIPYPVFSFSRKWTGLFQPMGKVPNQAQRSAPQF